jgi:hypothetical protein
MRLPEIADRLRAISAELEMLSEEMARRKPKNVAPRSSRRMTPELRAEIYSFAKAHPTMTQVAIGNHFRVNPGRVSESLAGFRV